MSKYWISEVEQETGCGDKPRAQTSQQNTYLYLRCQFPVCSLQFVDSVPADEQAGEKGVAVDAVVSPDEGDHQQKAQQQDHDAHLRSLINTWRGGGGGGGQVLLVLVSCSRHVSTTSARGTASQSGDLRQTDNTPSICLSAGADITLG